MRTKSGQAMVEFAIFLTILMAFCIGILVFSRLINFQLWAQQEARYLAYEQTEAAREYYENTGEEPIDLHQFGDQYGGPEQLSRINSIKRVGVGERASSVLSRIVDFSFVKTAYAKQFLQMKNENIGLVNNELVLEDKERKLERFLVRSNFAKRACGRLSSYSIAKNIDLNWIFPNCKETIMPQFAKHITSNMDLPDLIKDYKEKVERGENPENALQEIISLEFKEQYYSLFDLRVKLARQDANNKLNNDANNAKGTFNDPEVQKILNEARYVSSASAMEGIIDVSSDFNFIDSFFPAKDERSHIVYFSEFIFGKTEQYLENNSYDFNLSYLPVPRSFGADGMLLQETVMNSILGGFTEPGLESSDSDLRDSVIYKSGKYVEVNYRAERGLFPAAAEYMTSARQVELTAKHYLITQPWHITRRVGLGNYRSKGDQDVSVDSNSEEGILRRRTFGLWLYPAEFNQFAMPIFNIAGLGGVSSALQVLEPLDFILNETKKTLVKSPFRDLVDTLNKIPVIEDIIPELPQMPAVRPDSYPLSTELSGNEPGDPDKMIQNKVREYQDYVEEQRKLNPEPEPDFN